jgi:hypothetical protein
MDSAAIFKFNAFSFFLESGLLSGEQMMLKWIL